MTRVARALSVAAVIVILAPLQGCISAGIIAYHHATCENGTKNFGFQCAEK